MKTVIELLHEGARKFENQPYLGGKAGDAWKTFSYIESDRISSAFAASLVKLGFNKGDNISILSEGRCSWVLGEFGVLKAGCTSVPLSTKLIGEEIIFRLDHSESRAILVSENNFQKVAEILDKVQQKPAVICISDKTIHFAELIAKTSLTEGKDLFFYDDLVAEGEKLLDQAGPGGSTYAQKLEELEKTITEDDTVTICYTSGTTGNPKGIMLTHKNYLHNAINATNVVHVERGWKSLIMLPLDHSFAHTVGIYIFCYKGLTMYFVDAQGGPMAAMRNLPKNLVEINSDLLLTVPALSGNFMKKMIQGIGAKGPFIQGIFERGLKAGIARAGNGYNKVPLGTRIKNFFPWALANALIFPKLRSIFGTDIKFCIGGGALLEIKQQEFFNAIGAPVYQGYGLTENAPIICSNSAARHKFGTSGNIITDLDVRIMKDETTECRTGEIGQIVTRGGSVMKGYYKNPEATAETLRDGWLWSGDLGFKDADNFLVVTGREKALLISADGEKYSPETIEEAVINTSRFVNQIMAFNEQNKFTTALITLNAEELKAAMKEKGITADADADKVIDLIRDDLLVFKDHPDYSSIPVQWRPSSFAIIPSAFDESNGLINSTMKLVRHKVRDFYRPRIDELYAAGAADPHLPGNREALREAKILG
ncbi:AMP-dependent synthetase/ligase [Breznakiella homolactica]|uniref:AMP-binding protein n=1 Tax=Breznakiella homolactica TaxID=2798577 RepID=A0A7T7XQB0_9SPIR|nr:AMP-binding protein [Breznakiella homolactica]QQO10546.1 AMP-binding protein [Breznakiella homolactica]